MNNENIYNLIDEPWIPVLMRDGTTRSVSLGAVFEDTDGAIYDLALNPYERVAVFRLLLCIAQAALGYGSLKDETAWLSSKDDVGPISRNYLKKWYDSFFLYGPHAFLQPDCISLAKSDGATSCDKLILNFASGNNSTLYDHEAASRCRTISDAKLALGFLVYQNFSSGGLSGQCIWDGVLSEKIIRGAPCREGSMLFSIVLGNTLLEAIWLNLLTDPWIHDSLKTEWGVPFWEIGELTRDMTSGNENTYLGHLVPLSRAIKLKRGSPSCILGEALSYPQIQVWREPMASVKSKKGKKKNEFTETYVSSDLTRMPWRELSSILSVRETAYRKPALALRHLESLDEKDFTLWTGGLYSEKAKEISTVEWVAKLSVELLEEPAMHAYEDAIALANRMRGHLYSASEEYAQRMLVDKVSRFADPAERVYWDLLASPENQKIVLAVQSPTYMHDWQSAVHIAAEKAYRRACPALSARQMEAYVQGLSKLSVR